MVCPGSQPLGSLLMMMLLGGDGPHFGRDSADVGLGDGTDLANVAVGGYEAAVADTACLEIGLLI